jgi:hypothetical protein
MMLNRAGKGRRLLLGPHSDHVADGLFTDNGVFYVAPKVSTRPHQFLPPEPAFSHPSVRNRGLHVAQ